MASTYFIFTVEYENVIMLRYLIELILFGMGDIILHIFANIFL